MDYSQLSLDAHALHHGKLELSVKMPLKTTDDLSIAYTPGVAEPCRVIAKDPKKSFDLTWRGNTVAVITDGSAVLGLGNIGPEAAMPVMEGKCALFKAFGGVDAIPICLATQEVDALVETIALLEPSFGGINLEDISAPRCFEIERRLKERLQIPVFHDDQHGTAIVVLAGLYNALKVVGKNIETVRIVLSGSGAAGIAISELLFSAGAKNLILCDSKGILSLDRTDLNAEKRSVMERSAENPKMGTLQDAIKGADIFVGVSRPNLLTAEDIATMNTDAIVFAMANPTPEIMPDEAKKGGARIIATGRSDFPNQVNNVLVFPGIFKGVLEVRAREITPHMNLVAAKALAEMVETPNEEHILPSPLEPGVAQRIAMAIKSAVAQ
ncbi:MAG: NADP-dependent malic enzyme [Candidatus Peregrinibacteria bacterium]